AAISIRRSKKARSTPPSGSAPTMTRSSVSPRSPSTTTIPAGGKAAPNRTFWSILPSGTRLPNIYQAMIQACAREAGAWMTTKYDVLNPQALKRLVASGAVPRPFPQPVMEACYNSANEIYAELAQTNPHFKKMLDSLTAYRNDSYQWLQVAELTYDSFMMRMRTRT